ncbi:MAG: alpha/beta hydrolase [Ilumatobacteraceae bacterium]
MARRLHLLVLAGLLVLAPTATARGANAPTIDGSQPAAASTPAQRLAFAAQRYRTQIFSGATSSTVTYGTAPDLVTGQPVALQLDVYRPVGDTATSRPLLVWIHGGAFLNGNRGQMAGEAVAYARLGYVTASISYRLDPGNHCLQVQSGLYTGDELIAERARCERAILGARDDAAMAIAWLRGHAATYGIDTTRVAVGGSSAGAITAIHVGQTLNTPGSPPPAAAQVSAVLAMSGCNYVDHSIDAFDAPIAISASGGDPLVPFTCSVATADAAAAVGTPVQRNFYELESAHAQALYAAHRDEIDRSWRLFLIDHLHLA